MLNTSAYEIQLSPRGGSNRVSIQEELRLKQQAIQSRIKQKVNASSLYTIPGKTTVKKLETRSHSDPGIIIKISPDELSLSSHEPECKHCKHIICNCPDAKKRWQAQIRYEKDILILIRLTQLENNPINVRVMICKQVAKKLLELKKYDYIIKCVETLSKFRVTLKRRTSIEKILKAVFRNTPVCRDVIYIDAMFATMDKYDPRLSEDWLHMKLLHFRVRHNATHERDYLEQQIGKLIHEYSSRTVSDPIRAKGWYSLIAFEHEILGFTRHVETLFRECKGAEKLLEYQTTKVRAHIAEVSGFVQWKDQRDLEKCRTTFYSAYKYYSKGGNIKSALSAMCYSMALYNFIAKKKQCNGEITVLLSWMTSNAIEDSLAMMEENKQVKEEQFPSLMIVLRKRLINVLQRELREIGRDNKCSLNINYRSDVTFSFEQTEVLIDNNEFVMVLSFN